MKKFFYGWILLSLSMTAFAQESKDISGQVLYQLKSSVTSDQLAKFNRVMSQLGQAQSQKENLDKPYVEMINFGITKSVNSFDNKTVIKMLLETGAVEFAESNRVEYEIGYNHSDPDYNEQWFHQNMENEKAWEITRGRDDVVVAVCDSGVEANHEDLRGRILTPGYNFVTDKFESSPSTSHGTMVAGLIVAQNNSKGGMGIAPGVKVLPLKITTNGSTSLSIIAECIRYGADNGAKVINVSFTGINSSTVSAAGKYARDKGSLLIYAAGNQGNEQTNYPNWLNVVAVGATTSSDKRSSFSNYGPFIDIVAPGTAVYTTLPYLTRATAKYKAVNGTSFSAPITAAVAALIYSINPNFTPEKVEKLLLDGADDLGNDYVYGAGRVNTYNSLILAQREISENLKPNANFEYDTDSLVAPVKLTLDSDQSFDSDGSITSQKWYINNELVGSNTLEVFEISGPGKYEIKLVVTDNKGKSDSSVKTINVIDPNMAKILVKDVSLSISYSRTLATSYAKVLVTDQNNNPMTGVKVNATWDGEPTSAITGSDGIAEFTSPRKSRTHRFYFEVSDIEKDRYEYLSSLNGQSSDNILARQIWYRRIFGRF